MGVKPKFSSSDIKNFLNEKKIRIYKVITNRLIYIGERFVINARNNGNYLDQTGNLRSSIGYLVLYNGSIVSQNFKASGRGSDRTKGVSKAIDFAKSVADEYPKGFVLIVVAGMEYAAAVESKGKDVLTASSITAKNELISAMNDVKKLVNKS